MRLIRNELGKVIGEEEESLPASLPDEEDAPVVQDEPPVILHDLVPRQAAIISAAYETESQKLLLVTDADGTVVHVPVDVENADYQRVLEWVASGQEIQPMAKAA